MSEIRSTQNYSEVLYQSTGVDVGIQQNLAQVIYNLKPEVSNVQISQNFANVIYSESDVVFRASQLSTDVLYLPVVSGFCPTGTVGSTGWPADPSSDLCSTGTWVCSIESPSGAVMELQIKDMTAIKPNSDIKVKYKFRKTDGVDNPDNGGEIIDLFMTLYESNSGVESWTHTNVSAYEGAIIYKISDQSRATITGTEGYFSVGIEATVSSGGDPRKVCFEYLTLEVDASGIEPCCPSGITFTTDISSTSTYNEGDTVVLTGIATGEGPCEPTISYQWYKCDTLIAGETGTVYTFTANTGDNGCNIYVSATAPLFSGVGCSGSISGLSTTQVITVNSTGISDTSGTSYGRCIPCTPRAATLAETGSNSITGIDGTSMVYNTNIIVNYPNVGGIVSTGWNRALPTQADIDAMNYLNNLLKEKWRRK